MAAITVQPLNVNREGDWSFRDSALNWSHGQFGVRAAFDPFPAYPHDLGTVMDTVAMVSGVCEPIWNVELFIADREEVGRSNGFSNCRSGDHYDEGEWVKAPPTGLIMLAAKRVPIHPAVTRYLVAHEYGHNVEWMLNHYKGGHEHLYDDTTIDEYAEVRGLGPEHMHDGEGGTWHDSAHEIFACDFRILVCDMEAEFWPHKGVPRPEQVSGLSDWWNRNLSDLKYTEESAA